MVNMKDLNRRILETKRPYIQARYAKLVKDFDTDFCDVMDNKVMGIITKVRFGFIHKEAPGLYMEYTEGAVHAQTVLSLDDTAGLLEDYILEDVNNLLGLPIYLFKKGNMMAWVEPCLIQIGEKNNG
jgi:hypothetical protein